MSKLNDEWKVARHGPIEALGEDLWTVAGEIPLPLGRFPRRMTIVRLQDGRLVIWSAIPLDEASMQRLEAVERLWAEHRRHTTNGMVDHRRRPARSRLDPCGPELFRGQDTRTRSDAMAQPASQS